jgi:hypothetical protein
MVQRELAGARWALSCLLVIELASPQYGRLFTNLPHEVGLM